MIRTSFSTTLLLLAGACAPPPPIAPVVTTTTATTASAPVEVPHAPPDPTIVSVAAVRPPERIAIDGDLGEWGSFVPLPSLAQPLRDGKRATSEVAPNPPEAASRLALALTGDGALIAAHLGEAAREGIWLGVGAWAPDLPRLGVYSRGGVLDDLECKFERVVLGEGAHENGPPNPPEVVAACEALIDRHAKLIAAQGERFARVFKIDREGVLGVEADGTLAPIPGARAVWKAGPGGAAVELSLPLAALPRVAEAPLEALRLAARAVTAPRPPALTPKEWVWVSLPSPISFAPYADLRAALFEQQRDIERDPSNFGGTIFMQPEGLSYHPASPLRIEHVHYVGGEYDYTRVGVSEQALYEKRESLDDVEVGPAAGGGLAIFRKGKLVEAIGLNGSLRGVVRRAGELHVLSFSLSGFTEAYGFYPARWSVIAVAQDGSHRDVDVDESVDAGGSYEAPWTSVEEITSKDFTRFGMRAVVGKKGVEVIWTWDEAHKRYGGKRRDTPAPTTATKSPGKKK